MRRNPAPLLLGILFLGVGLIALLSRVVPGLPSLGQLVSNGWPAILIALGIAAWLSAPRSFLAPLILVGLGSFFLLRNLGLITLSLWEIAVPLAIIAVGLALLLPSGRGRAADAQDGTAGTTLRTNVLLSGANLRPVTADFRGGSLSAVLGGIEVDLRSAQLVGTARLDTFCMLGGIDLKVPPTWRVVVDGTPILAGFEDKTTQPIDPNAPVLQLRSTAILGGVEIKN